MEIEVREAGPSEAPAVAALLAELGYPADAGVGDRLADWVRSTERWVLVAEADGDLRGLLSLTVTPRLERTGRWAQVVAVVVAAAHRGGGIGGALLRHAESLAVSEGADMVVINSARTREAAHAFYAARGYRDRCVDHAQFVKTLTAAGDG